MADIYQKSKNYFKLSPNLVDYNSVYQSFSWEKVARKDLKWFPDGRINAAYNAIDKHLLSPQKNKIALIWEGAAGQKQTFTFQQMSELSNKFGNLLKNFGAIRGDRVFIFLPRVPLLYISFLGILKIGGVAGTLFSAFQEQALFDRLFDSGAKILITNSELSQRLEKIKSKLPDLKHILIVDDQKFETQLNQQSASLRIEHMSPDDFAFMLYTSGTTGKPKGVVHKHYAIVAQHITAKYVLDFHDQDIYWCTADPGWVTGISYTILGVWTNSTTSVIFEGRFDAAKWYQILQDYKVTIWYTAPTAIRMLMAEGIELPKQYNLSNLRHLLSVGEPLNPEAIHWGIRAFNLPFHDNWWQTETGCICIANYPCMDIKIGSMGKPFPGITASIVDDKGQELLSDTEGNIALRPGWPSMMKTIWKNEEKYNSYFINNWPARNASHSDAGGPVKSVSPARQPDGSHGGGRSDAGWYITGDRGLRDKDGYFWFIGRADDVIKTSGERVGPFEVESALVEHPAVVEAGVIGKPDKLRGEIIKAFVVLKPEYLEKVKDITFAEQLKQELSMYVKKHLAGHAYPREVEFIDKLPKTRSGKIMRRILKAKELGLPIGDTSTLEEY